MNKNKSLIPKGYYCYTRNKSGKVIKCPYWRSIKERPEQYDGWCDFLEKGDIEINKETPWTDARTKEKQTAEELGLPMSLLWDMCKECQINLGEEDGR